MTGSEVDQRSALAALIQARAARLAREGRLKAAAETLHQLVTQAPDLRQPRILLAQVLGQQARFGEALALLAGVEGVDAERLRQRLAAMSSQRGGPIRRRGVIALGAGFLLLMTLLGFGTYRSLVMPSDHTAAESSVHLPDPKPPATATGHGTSSRELLSNWTRLVRTIDSLPTIHQVHLRAEIREGLVVAVVEGEVIGDSTARRLGDSVASGLAADLTGLVVSGRYQVAGGDTLSRLAGRIYGDSTRWVTLWKANRSAIPDPDLIMPGLVLEVP